MGILMTHKGRNLRNGLLFTSPWLVGFGVFMLYPLLASLYYGFCDYSVLLPAEFVGVDNYVEMATDRTFWKALWNTVFYAAMVIPMGFVMALSLALLLNTNVRGLAFYRTIFFLPSLVPVVALSALWLWIYNGELGVLNHLLAKVGIDGPAWLAEPEWAKPAFAFMSVWGIGHAMVIYLAGLQDVPKELLDAAVVDGANRWQRLWHVTLPMISPVIYFNLIMGLIGSFQVFTQAFMMTDGGPEESTLFYALHLYRQAFTDMRMGYASAMAWVLFLIILGLTLLGTRFSRQWIHYER